MRYTNSIHWPEPRLGQETAGIPINPLGTLLERGWSVQQCLDLALFGQRLLDAVISGDYGQGCNWQNPTLFIDQYGQDIAQPFMDDSGHYVDPVLYYGHCFTGCRAYVTKVPQTITGEQ